MQSLLSDQMADDYWLVLDSSAPVLQIGLFKGDRVINIKNLQGEAVEHLVETAQTMLKANSVNFDQLEHFIYCQGPGSILGIRIAIMAIKTWITLCSRDIPASVFYYSSIHAAKEHLTSRGNKSERFIVTAEWKKNHWNVLESDDENSQISIWDTQNLLDYKGSVYLLPQKKLWTTLPDELPRVQYSIEMLAQPDTRKAILLQKEDWPIYTPETKSYARWSGERHRKQE